MTHRSFIGRIKSPACLPLVAAFSSLILLSGCIADPDFENGAAQPALLEAYQAQMRAGEEEREQREATAIRLLDVSVDETSRDLVLSVDLLNADLARTLSQVLESPFVQYSAELGSIKGRVSARFNKRPLIEGLNILLADTGLVASNSDGVVTIQYDLFGHNSDYEANMLEDENQPIVSSEVVLKHLAAVDVVRLLSELYPPNDAFDEPVFTFSELSELNAVYVSGPAADVSRALALISGADRPVSHVIIEALVVDIDTSSIETLGLSFQDGASGKFSAASIIPGQIGGNIVATFTDLASDSAQVSAKINFLAAQNVAQVLARPYIATRSTMPATIAIVDDQFARVDTSGDDSSIISTDSVTAGITMEVTPVVMADDAIRLDVTIEDSRFGATAGDIIITKERSSASTSMIVDSGQTIMIGGLNSRYRITENSGLPWLRRIPLLNVFAGEQGALERRSELVVYLTPYVWIPGMESPLPLPGTPDPNMPDLVGMELGGKSFD